MKELLKVVNISKSYGVGEGRTAALRNVSLTVYDGELLVILGSSGSGKSTLLNMIGGMDVPDKGKILIGHDDICRYNDRQRTYYRKKKIGFVFQSFNLVSVLTVRENVALTAATPGLVDLCLTDVGLKEKMNHYPSQLSGGEQQRVSIARALAKKPQILLCDEPTGALDYETGKQVLEKLESLSRKLGKTVVIVTHTKEIGKTADRVINMRSGKIIGETVNEHPVSVKDIDW